jgi:hypothetical protein
VAQAPAPPASVTVEQALALPTLEVDAP